MKEQNIYAYAAFIRVGYTTMVQTMRIMAASRTLARIIADREAHTMAEHEAAAQQAISGQHPVCTIHVNAL